MPEMIPGGHNLAFNPSFEGTPNGYINSTGGVVVTHSYTTDWFFSGVKSMAATVTTAGAGTITLGISSTSEHRIPVSPSTLYGASIAVHSPGAGVQAQLYVAFVDAAGAGLGSSYGDVTPVPANGIARLHVAGAESPATAAFAVLRVSFTRIAGDTWTLGSRVFIDAMQLNTGGTPDHYIDGDQGTGYTWDGVAHASISRRADFQLQGPTGAGGVVEVTARVYLADIQGNIGTEITGYILAGTWDWDIDRDGPKTVVRLTVDGADIIQPMEWIAIFLDVFYEDGSWESGQLGLFRMELPDRRYSRVAVEVEVAGFDAIILLEDRTLETNVTLAAGTNIVSTIRSYLTSIGVRHSIPSRSNVISSAGASWKVHTKWSTFLNELAAMAGLYALHTTIQGHIITRPVIASLADEQAAHLYTVGRDSKLIGDIMFKPNGSAIFNRVVVARDDPALGTILTSVRSFSDPASPYSTTNMGVKTKGYSMQNATTQAVLDAYADARIQELSLFMYGELKVIPSPHHRPYEVVELDLISEKGNPALAIHDGKYYVKAASFDLMSPDGTMGLSIRRTERFDNV